MVPSSAAHDQPHLGDHLVSQLTNNIADPGTLSAQILADVSGLMCQIINLMNQLICGFGSGNRFFGAAGNVIRVPLKMPVLAH